MAALTYTNFDVELVREGPAGYRVRVTGAPVGDRPSEPFAVPFDATVLENLLLRLDPGRARLRRVATDPQTAAARQLGGGLFTALFTGDVLLAWVRSEAVAEARRVGLRLRLHLAAAPELAGLPWELLYDVKANAFLAQSEKTPLVRYLDVTSPLRPIAIDGPMRILAVIAAATDLPPLDVAAEWDRLRHSLQPRIDTGVVVVDRLPEPTIACLAGWLRRNEVHVLHFIGHGEFDERQRDGVLYFCDAQGRGDPVASDVLGPYVHDHDPLRLVVLNACQTARADVVDPYSGMAQGLIQHDVTAVVAMQFPISDDAAVTFSGDFYGAVADGFPVDQAVTSARKALLGDYGQEWATPSLFMRSDDGRIFEHVHALDRPVTPVERTSVEPTPVEPRPVPVPVPVPTWPTDGAGQTGAAERTRNTDLMREAPPAPRPEPDVEIEPVPFVAPPTRPGRLGIPVAVASLVVALLLGWLIFRDNAAPPPGDGGTTSSAPSTPPSTPPTTTPPSTPPSTTTAPRPLQPGPTVAAAPLTPRLDADPGDWRGVTPFASNRVIASSGGDSQVRATWVLGYDAANFYFYVEVIDAAITQTHADEPAQLFKGDSVSFEIGQRRGSNDRLLADDLHVLIGPDPDGGPIAARNVSNGKVFVAGRLFRNARVAQRLTSEGYVLEGALPWNDLNLVAPKPGVRLAANFNASDAVAAGSRRGEFEAMISNNPQRFTNDFRARSGWGS